MKSGKHVILCVDDDPDILDSVRIVLEASGFVVETAPSAEDGLRAFQRSRPDLVIVDLMMEEVDAGTDLVRSLKAAGNTAPVFMLSSLGDQLNQTIDTAGLGLSGVFQKPVKFESLVKVVRATLA